VLLKAGRLELNILLRIFRRLASTTFSENSTKRQTNFKKKPFMSLKARYPFIFGILEE
jgi:hypothetical protein